MAFHAVKTWLPLRDAGGSAPLAGVNFEPGGSRAAATGWIRERDRYRIDETVGIALAGSVRATARVEPGPAALKALGCAGKPHSLAAKIEKPNAILQRYCNGFD